MGERSDEKRQKNHETQEGPIFKILSPRDIDLCPMTMQMHRNTVLANVYTSAKFHQDRMKNDREIATSVFFSILCPCDLGL